MAALLLAGCTPLGTKPVVKIGLVAPLEGLYRSLGYEVLNAVKLAALEYNESGGAAGYMVKIVALDDSNDPAQAVPQAKKMAIDQDVMGVIGGFSSQTAVAASEEYHRALLAFVALAPADVVTERCYPEVFRLSAPNILLGREVARYTVRELGAIRSHDPRAILAYHATWILLRALTQAIERDGRPTREGMMVALHEACYTPLSGAIALHSCGKWVDPPIHIHRIK